MVDKYCLRIRFNITLLTTKFSFSSGNLCVNDERGKSPLAISRFDARRIKLIYCDSALISFLNCWNLLYPQ